LETRYALRELESAIGYDCRRLEDGRAAVFRHTGLHRRLRRDFYERRDAVAYYHTAFVAFAAGSAGKPERLAEAEETRQSLMRTMFPYLHFKQEKTRQETFDDLFDELDEIIAAKNAEDKAKRDTGAPSDVGSTG
jgi:hypothetical protein